MFDHFFSLHENRDAQLAGLMEAKTRRARYNLDK